MASQAVGDEVKVLLGFLAALFDDALQGALIGGGLCFRFAGGERRFHDA
jgi:hypothetical protein